MEQVKKRSQSEIRRIYAEGKKETARLRADSPLHKRAFQGQKSRNDSTAFFIHQSRKYESILTLFSLFRRRP